MDKLIFKDIVKKEHIHYLVSCVLVLLTYVLWSFILFNREAVDNAYGGSELISSHDSQFIDNLGVEGITRQSYILPLFFLLLILFVYFIFWGYLSYRKHNENIMLMRVRGISKKESQYLFLYLRAGLFLTTCLFTLLPYLLFLVIFYWIGQTKHMIIRFTPWLFLFMLVYALIFIITNLPFYTRPYSKQKLVRFLRENY